MCRLRSLPVLAVLVSVVALPARAEEPRLDRLGDPLPDGAVARLGTNRLRHPHGALGITFSPDGKTLFTAGYGAVLHHWDVTTGKQVGTLDVPVGPLRSVDFTRDGKTMLTSTLFGDAHFALDAETGKVRREFGRRPDPNAVGIGGERDGVRNTALSPDGNILVRAARTLRQWDLRTGTTSDLPIQADKVQEGSVPWDYAVAFAADGGQLAVVEEDGVLLVEAVSGKKIRRFALTGGVCVALSPDGKTLAVGVTDGTVRLWAVDTGKEVQTLRHHSSAVRGLLFGPDGRSLYASAYAGIGCWEAGDGRWPMRWAVAAPTAAIALSRDGQVLASVGGLGAVFLWDAVSGKERLPLDRHTSSVSAVAFSPNGRTLASASSDTLLLWDVPGSRLRREFAAVDGAHSLAFSPDGRLLAAGHETQPPRLLEAGTGKLVRRFEQQGMSPSGVSFSSGASA